MNIRFLPLTEFHNVYFYRFITFVIFVAMSVLILVKASVVSDLLVLGGGLLVMAWRFTVECLRLKKCAPAFIYNDELIISADDHDHRQIPLNKIRSIESRHSLFLVRRYRSWSEHVAFLEITLNNGERVYTLAEGAVLEFPAAKGTLEALRSTVAAAKAKSLANQRP